MDKEKSQNPTTFIESLTQPNGQPVQLCQWQKDFIERFEQVKKNGISDVYLVAGRRCGISSISRTLRANANNLPRTGI